MKRFPFRRFLSRLAVLCLLGSLAACGAGAEAAGSGVEKLALTGGGPANATEMVSMNIFNEIFAKSNYGYGQAKAIVFFIIVGVITMFQVRLTSKREVEV